MELPFVVNERALIGHGSKPLGRSHPETSIGWYRRSFDIPAADAAKRITLEFDGVFRDSVVFLNGHYDNTYAIAYACAAAASAGRLPDGVSAFPVNYWDGMTPEEAGEFFGPTAGLHANRAETSAVMAIDERFVDLVRREHAFWGEKLKALNIKFE